MGNAASAPNQLMAIGNTLYFSADDGLRGDTAVESNETFRVTLSGASGGATIISKQIEANLEYEIFLIDLLRQQAAWYEAKMNYQATEND